MASERPTTASITRQQLKDYCYIPGELTLITQRINQLESDRELLRSFHLPQYLVDYREELLKQQLHRCVADGESVEAWIATIPDAYTRGIFARRYLQALPWKQVAEKMHSTSDACRKWRDRYLKKERIE